MATDVMEELPSALNGLAAAAGAGAGAAPQTNTKRTHNEGDYLQLPKGWERPLCWGNPHWMAGVQPCCSV